MVEPTPLKNMGLSNWDDDSQYMESKTCSNHQPVAVCCCLLIQILHIIFSPPSWNMESSELHTSSVMAPSAELEAPKMEHNGLDLWALLNIHGDFPLAN